MLVQSAFTISLAMESSFQVPFLPKACVEITRVDHDGLKLVLNQSNLASTINTAVKLLPDAQIWKERDYTKTLFEKSVTLY